MCEFCKFLTRGKSFFGRVRDEGEKLTLNLIRGNLTLPGIETKKCYRQKLLRVGPFILMFHQSVFTRFDAVVSVLCITHGSPGSVLVTATVQQQPCCEVFTRRDSHRRCFCVYCVYTCVLLYVPSVCMACMVSQTQQCTGEPQQQQVVQLQGACFKLLPMCQSSRGVWVVGAQQEVEIR